MRSVVALVAASVTVLAGARLDAGDGPARATDGAVPVVTLIGAEYAMPGLGATLAASGAPAIKYFPDSYAWGRMQASATASIDFSVTDRYVREYQRAGFRELVMALRSQSSWASRDAASDPSPRPEYLDLYARWVAAVVERYDGDGIDDMPDLLRPVRLYEIGTEFSGYEPEPVDHYIEMLTRAHAAAHAAFAGVLVAHAAFLTTTVFRDDPSPEEYEAAFAAASPRIVLHPLADLRAVLDRGDSIDLVNLHSLGEPDEIAPMVRWLRWEMAQRGYDRPVIISDTATTPFIAWGPATRCTGTPNQLGIVVPPAIEADRCRLADYFTRLVDGDPATVRWTQAFAAADLVAKVVSAAAAGVELIDTWSTEDIALLKLPLFAAGAGTAAWAGMVDATINPFTQERTVTGHRPALFALGQVVRHLGQAATITRLAASDRHVRLFRLDGGGSTRWVGWIVPDRLVLPGDAVPSVPVVLDAPAGPVVLERVAGSTQAPCTYIALAAGPVTVALTPAPVFVVAGLDAVCPSRLRRRLH